MVRCLSCFVILLHILVGTVASSTAEILCEYPGLSPSGAVSGAHTGECVTVCDDWALAGAPYDETDGVESGLVRVFRRSGQNWVESSPITADDGETGDRFGCAVATDGTMALVGASHRDGVGADAGAVYVFLRSGLQWYQVQRITPPDPRQYDYFGGAVAIGDDRAIVGAHRDDDSGFDSGSAYLFRRSGTVWYEEEKVTASDGAAGDYFGWSVSISGDLALVGALNDDDAGHHSGSAFLFRRSGDQWSEVVKLIADDAAADDQFGCSVSIEGDWVLVGANGHDGGGENAGAAYLFTLADGVWVESVRLATADIVAQDSFGRSVGLCDPYAAVGAPGDDDPGSSSGSVTLFQRTGNSWGETVKLIRDGATSGEAFGSAVAISGSYAAGGAPFAHGSADQSGAVSIVGISPSGCGTVAARLACSPESGTLPFETLLTVVLTNHDPLYARLVAGSVHLTLPGGRLFSNWRSESFEIDADESVAVSWRQLIPERGTVLGPVRLHLVAQDVTPPPYNQPPYPPSGDSGSDCITVHTAEPDPVSTPAAAGRS